MGLAVLAMLVVLAAALPLALLSRQLGGTLPAVVFGLPSAAVGVLVARRQPRQPLG